MFKKATRLIPALFCLALLAGCDNDSGNHDAAIRAEHSFLENNGNAARSVPAPAPLMADCAHEAANRHAWTIGEMEVGD